MKKQLAQILVVALVVFQTSAAAPALQVDSEPGPLIEGVRDSLASVPAAGGSALQVMQNGDENRIDVQQDAGDQAPAELQEAGRSLVVGYISQDGEANHAGPIRQEAGAALRLEQIGQANQATVEQAGGVDSFAAADLRQEGKANRLALVQRSPGSFAGIDQGGEANHARIGQEGEANLARISQRQTLAFSGEASNRAEIDQVGSGLVAEIDQTGAGHLATIAQLDGASQSLASIIQAGAGHLAGIVQRGSGHQASISQTGNSGGLSQGHQASITQAGADNLASIIQSGLAHSADIRQDGSDNFALVEQTSASLASQVSIDQTNDNNHAEVHAHGGGTLPAIIQGGGQTTVIQQNTLGETLIQTEAGVTISIVH